MKLKILVIIGTRPEAIKMAPVIRELSAHPDRIVCTMCATGQHREMVDQVLRVFGIRPQFDLEVMTADQSLSGLAATILQRVQPILDTVKPDWVLLQGDTTTVAAASLAAFYSRVRIGHVEAGLRTYDTSHPFPEEMNRRVAATLADLHFAPTEQARVNLLLEGVARDRIILTGNPIVDAMQWATRLPFNEASLPFQAGSNGHERKLVLVTAHRRESFGRPLENICRALRELAARYHDMVHFVYPVHLNPNIWRPVNRLLANAQNVTLAPPLDYLTFLNLVKRAYLVLTDSGGVQEEAATLGIPVVILRERTERTEILDLGLGKVTGYDKLEIVRIVSDLLDNPEEYQRMVRVLHPYGDGYAGQRIVRALLQATGVTEHAFDQLVGSR